VAGLLVAGCQSPPQATYTRSEAKTQAIAEAKTPVAEPTKPGAREKDVDAPPLRADGTVFAGAEQMGTRVTVKVWVGPGQTPAQAGTAIQDAFAEVERIEEIASEWRPHSELSQLNGRAGQAPAPMSPDLYTILARSKQIAATSNGAFDPTFHGIGQLWSFAQGARPPPPEAIKEHLKLVNWRELELVAGTPDPAVGAKGRLRVQGMKVGLGAIAKGYAVDRASEVLKRHGFAHHIVEGGGDTYVSGTKDGKTWMVGIQNPEGPGSIGALPVQDQAVVTSGDYQRFFEFEGKRYAHILDPRTGWPVARENSARSVTVVADNATDADAMCTAVAVMGPKDGMAFVEAHPEIEAVILPPVGEAMVSSGLQGVYKPLAPSD